MRSSLRSTSREPDEFAAATEHARRTRERVADQVRELVIEGDRMGGRGEVALRIQRLIEAEEQVRQAQAGGEQAREMGNPIQPFRDLEKGGREALRSAVMGLAVGAASWVAAMDHAAEVTARAEGRPAPA